MTHPKDSYREKRHERIRRIKRIMRPLPRKAMIHKYPVLRHFAGTARERSYLWSFRQRYVVRAIYMGCVLSLLPVYGLQVLLAFVLSLMFQANLMVMVALQFITNPLTAIPLYMLCFQVGDFVMSPFTEVPMNVEFVEIQADSASPAIMSDMVAGVLEQHAGEDTRTKAHNLIYIFMATSVGGVILGLVTAVILSFVYQWVAREAVISYKWVKEKRHEKNKHRN